MRTFHSDGIQELKQAEFLEVGMGNGTPRTPWLEGALAHTLALRLQRTLEIECLFKFFLERVANLLPLADGIELVHVMLLAVGVSGADADTVAFLII